MAQAILDLEIILKKTVLKTIQPMKKYFKKISSAYHISEWKSEGLSDEITQPPATFDIVLLQH